MAYAVEEYDDDLAVARLAWLAHVDQACDVCLRYTDIDLGIRAGRSGCWPGCCTPTSPLTARAATADTTVGCQMNVPANR